jgi:hypothetical protein
MRMTREEREHRFMNLAAGVGSLDNIFSFIRDLMQDLNATEVALAEGHNDGKRVEK